MSRSLSPPKAALQPGVFRKLVKLSKVEFVNISMFTATAVSGIYFPYCTAAPPPVRETHGLGLGDRQALSLD